LIIALVAALLGLFLSQVQAQSTGAAKAMAAGRMNVFVQVLPICHFQVDAVSFANSAAAKDASTPSPASLGPSQVARCDAASPVVIRPRLDADRSQALMLQNRGEAFEAQWLGDQVLIRF
jgi:hypothetical protein